VAPDPDGKAFTNVVIDAGASDDAVIDAPGLPTYPTLIVAPGSLLLRQ